MQHSFAKTIKGGKFASTKKPKTTIIMAYKISDECISCGTCAGECPVEAISEGQDHYVIDPEKCMSCGTCASACPTGAIKEE